MSSSRARPALVLAIALASLSLVACRREPHFATDPDSRPPAATAPGFDDHSVGRVLDLEHFERLSNRNVGATRVLKFVVTRFAERRNREIRYLDSNFYRLHDEWYWFRLLNGVRVPGAGVRAVDERHFDSPQQIVDWAREQRSLPLDLRWSDPERLYSDRFYDDALRSEPRRFGLGNLVHLPSRPASQGRPAQPELWAFELQYSDEPSRDEIETFVALLKASLPPAIADHLHWLVRSPAQERLVATLAKSRHPIADLAVSYASLATPGELEIYNPGLVAGRLRRIPADDPRLWQTRANDILILDALPDHLPQAAAILTSIPQTPLAHLNLLARNRGIPNAYLGGVADDPNFEQLARVHAPVLVHAANGELVVTPISDKDYATWLGLRRDVPPVIDRIRVEDLPLVVDLERESTQHLAGMRAVIGGKAAGFVALREGGIVMPEGALSITVRAYVEHMNSLATTVDNMLADPEFKQSAPLRMLVLEGTDDFSKRSVGGKKVIAKLLAARAEDDVLRRIIAAGGLRRMIRDRPIDPVTLAEIEGAIARRFDHFHATQGLRFRSSSNVEDISGFNGAGLYTSSTGFLHAEKLADPGDRKRTIEAAILRTWASYWSVEAFEERRLAGIDHRDGAMGVLVHARFDDGHERSNGVFTFTSFPPDASLRAEMVINVQAGALSVTNPPLGKGKEVTPEIIRVTAAADPGAKPVIERVARSSVATGGEPVLGDAAVLGLFGDAQRVSTAWLTMDNRGLAPAQRRRSVVLDFEFRETEPGWPALADDPPRGGAMVLKQVRPLEPPAEMAIERLAHLPIPRDLLVRAARIENRVCTGDFGAIEVLEVYTDPLATPDPGFATVPFTASVRIAPAPLPGRGRKLTGRGMLTHEQLVRTHHPTRAGGGADWDLEVEFGPRSRETNVERLTISSAGLVDLSTGGRQLVAEPARCTSQTLLDSPEAFLRTLLTGSAGAPTPRPVPDGAAGGRPNDRE